MHADIIEHLLMGVYPAIICCAALALWRVVRLAIVPTYRQGGSTKLLQIAFSLGACLALAAHVFENAWQWPAAMNATRWGWMTSMSWATVTLKLVVLASGILMLASTGLHQPSASETPQKRWKKDVKIGLSVALFFWALGVIVSYIRLE